MSAAGHPLFENESWVRLWNQLLAVQVNLCGQADLDALGRVPAWPSAQRILDLGCGNGVFIQQLARLAPERQFVGLDVSEPLIREARRRSPANLSCLRADLNSMDPASLGQFDIVIARFLVQHLPSLTRFLRQANDLLRPGGNLLIYDANDSMIHLSPEVAAVQQFYTRLAAHQNKGTLGRDLVGRLQGMHRETGFLWHGSAPLIHVVDDAEDKRLLRDYFASCFAVARTCMELDFDIADGERQLDAWRKAPGSWGQYASRLITLARPDHRLPRFSRPSSATGTGRVGASLAARAENENDWGRYLPAPKRRAGRSNRIRVAGFFSYDFGAELLSHLIALQREFDIEVVGVATDNLISKRARISKSKRAWRYLDPGAQIRRQLRVERMARDAGIDYFSGNIKSAEFSAGILRRWAPGAIFMFGFGQLVPPTVFEFPRYGMYNFHPSDLENGEYRGADPFGEMIRDRRTSTVLSVHEVDPNFDTGRVVAASPPIPLGDPDSTDYRDFGVWCHRLIEPSKNLVTELVAALLDTRAPLRSFSTS